MKGHDNENLTKRVSIQSFMMKPIQHSQRPHDVYSISLHIEDGTVRKLYNIK